MRWRRLLLAAILICAAGFRLAVIDRPFHFDAEGSGSFYGILARNYLRFDWAQTRGIPVLTVGDPSPAPIVFYPDHPPLTPLLIVPSYRLFGVGEWQTRLPFAIATLAAIGVLYVLLMRFASGRVALLGAALFAAAPMTLYFGGFPEVVGLPLVLFVLLSVLAYLEFHRTPSARTLAWLTAAFAMAGLVDWPAFILVPVLLVHFVATRPRRQWPWMVAFCAMACVVFAGIYGYVAIASHAGWDWMLPLLKRRTTIGVRAPFTAGAWLAQAWADNRMLHTVPLIAAAVAWVAAFGWRVRRDEPGATVARLLLAWGVLHVAIGLRAVHYDEWWWSPMTPGIVVAAALLLDALLELGTGSISGPATETGPISEGMAPALCSTENSARPQVDPPGTECRNVGKLASSFRSAEYSARPQLLDHVAQPAVALLLVLFASWTGYTSFRDLYPARPDRPFTSIEMGQAIQTAAPGPNDLAMVVGFDTEAPLWFYGDRPLRTRIWVIDDLERRLNDTTAELVFDMAAQPWDAAATGIVFPLTHRGTYGALHAYLQRHYPPARIPAALAEKFEVFDLRRPLTDARYGRWRLAARH